MARVDGEYIGINSVFGNKDGVAKKAVTSQYNLQNVKRMVMDGKIVFDRWNTVLSASDFSIGAEGGVFYGAINVSSYGVDVKGGIHQMDYYLSPISVGSNESTESKTHTISVIQDGTYDSIDVMCVQEGKEAEITITGYRYESVVTREDIGKAPATNNYTTLSLKVSGTVYIYEQYSDGTESYYGSQDFSSVTAYVYDGSSTTGAYAATGNVIVPPVGTTTYDGDRVAFTITKYYFDVLGESFHKTTSLDVYQAENKITGQEWGTSSSDYSLSISSSVSSFTSNGGTSTISVQCQQRYRDVYTSGSKGEWIWADATASLSTTYGSLSGSSVTGKGSVTLSVGNDTGNGYTAKVTASAGNGAKTASVSIPQTKRVEKSRAYHTPTGTPANISTVAVTGNVTVYLTIASWTQSYTITYDNGTTSTGSTSGTNASAIVTKGSGINGTYINNGGVYIPNAGTDYYTTDRTAYTITGYSFSANGVTATPSASIAIKQKANTRTETPEYYLALISQSAASIANAGGTFTFVAESLVRTKYTYLTNQTAYSEYSNSEASVTYSNGVTKVSPSAISGKQTVTVTVGENYDSARTPKVIVTSKGDSSKTISVTVSQAAVAWVFSAETKEFNVAYNTKTQQISGTSSRNGLYVDIQKSDVSVTGGKLYNDVVTSSGTTFYATISFDENTTNSQRTITAVVTQRRSGSSSEKLTYTITQAAQPSVITYVSWVKGTGKYVVGSRYTFSATLKFHKSVNGNTVYITPMKNSTEIMAASAVRLSGTSLDGDYYSQVVSLQVQPQSLGTGEAFYLKLQYGSTEDTIQLVGGTIDPLNV